MLNVECGQGEWLLLLFSAEGRKEHGGFSVQEPIGDYFLFSLFSSVLLFRINKPGGCGKITKIHYGVDGRTVESLDVKYVVGSGSEKELDPGIVFPYENLERTGRQRRGREFLGGRVEDIVLPRASRNAQDENEQKQANAKKGATGKKTTTTNNKRKPTAKSKADKRVKQDLSGNNPLVASAETTSPSTPEQKKKQKAKKVTPIPAYVLATTDCDVSPLFATGWNDTTQSTAVARRGLFDDDEDKDLISKPAAMQKTTKKKKALKLSAVAPGDEIKRTPEKKMAAKENNKSATAPSSKTAKKSSGATTKAARAMMPSTKTRPVVLASSELRKAEKPTRPAPFELAAKLQTAKKAPPKATESQGPKYASMQAKKMELLKTAPVTKPILAFPRPKQMALPKVGGRKALKEVYEDERRKAKQFLDDICGARDGDIVVEPSKENDNERHQNNESKESL
jgi:hypothetical protein